MYSERDWGWGGDEDEDRGCGGVRGVLHSLRLGGKREGGRIVSSLLHAFLEETETCMVWTYRTPRQPPQNHSSRHPGGWATAWSAEEMLDGQHQRVDYPAPTRTAHKGLLQKRLEEDLY